MSIRYKKENIEDDIIVASAINPSEVARIDGEITSVKQSLSNKISQTNNMISDVWSAGTYTAGTFKIKDNILYKAKVQTNSTPPNSDWECCSVGNELNNKANTSGYYTNLNTGRSDCIKDYNSDSLNISVGWTGSAATSFDYLAGYINDNGNIIIKDVTIGSVADKVAREFRFSNPDLNLNNVVKSGGYYISEQIYESVTNAPITGKHAHLHVFESANTTLQLFCTLNAGAWMRVNWWGTWYPWQKITS